MTHESSKKRLTHKCSEQEALAEDRAAKRDVKKDRETMKRDASAEESGSESPYLRKG